VHGTTLTLLNASRLYLNSSDLTGGLPLLLSSSFTQSKIFKVVFVTSGLGGMSGAQPKAGVICGAIAVVAEGINEKKPRRKRFVLTFDSTVIPEALYKRHRQGIHLFCKVW
jgi:urocanate hydratase